jgi:hypothetical protein
MNQHDDDFRPPTKSVVGLMLAFGIVLGAAALVVLLVMFSGEPVFDGKAEGPAGREDKPADLKPHRMEGGTVVE